VSTYASIKRNGRNSDYENPFDLPFAPARAEWAEDGVEYLAGTEVGGRTCAAGCGVYVAVTSHVVAVDNRWRHARCANKKARTRVAFADPDDATETKAPAKLVTIFRDYDIVLVSFSYDPEVIAALKASKRRGVWAKWSPGSKLWRVPAEIWPEAAARIAGLGYEVVEG
jgi:hypothetical protein